jgi:hypothetical protein
MLTPEQIYRRARHRYQDFLRSICTGQPFFPLNVFGAGMVRPKDFAADRAAIEILRKQSKEQIGYGYEITWVEQTFRRLGMQKIPRSVTFPTQQDYVRALNKQSEVRQFMADYDLIRQECPELEKWAQAKPIEVVTYARRWDKLLAVCTYMQRNPCPGCYLRELPVVMDTKFIENHVGVLSQLLPIAAPSTVTSDDTRFESRFGFRCKQSLVRVRFLDRDFGARLKFSVFDFATPLDEFRNLPLGGNTVVIVENEMTFLTLPTLPETIAVYGAGDAAALLVTVAWLGSCRVFYWGDLDSHGFEILSNLRRQFPNVTSILMDECTLSDHNVFAVEAAATRAKGRLELTPVEQLLYDRLVETGKLLEQERIPDSYSRPRLWQAVWPNRIPFQ